MTLENLTPFAAELFPSHDERGRSETIVVVKATLDLQGRWRHGRKQVPVLRGDVFYEGKDFPAHVVRLESDWVPFKPLTDLIINGFAYAPKGRAARQFDIGLQVGKTSLTARAFGPRRWVKRLGWTLTEPEPAVKAPLACIGARASSNDQPEDVPASPIEWLDTPHQREAPSHACSPAGFGVFDRTYLPRRGYAGTYAKQGASCAPGLESSMPANFDTRYWNCAHPRLQFPRSSIGAGTRIKLWNMSECGDVEVTLPEVPVAISSGLAQDSLKLDFDTVVLEPDDERLILIWRHRLKAHLHDAGSVAVHLACLPS